MPSPSLFIPFATGARLLHDKVSHATFTKILLVTCVAAHPLAEKTSRQTDVKKTTEWKMAGWSPAVASVFSVRRSVDCPMLSSWVLSVRSRASRMWPACFRVQGLTHSLFAILAGIILGMNLSLERASFMANPGDVAAVSPENLAEKEYRYQVTYYSARYSISPELSDQILRSASAEGLDPELGFRLVRVESVFDPEAVSPAGAVGLTQLMPSTARWLSPDLTGEEIREPSINLTLGFRFLKHLLRDYKGDVSLALAAYNRGPGRVNHDLKMGRNPLNGYEALVIGPKSSGKAKSHYQGDGRLAD